MKGRLVSAWFTLALIGVAVTANAGSLGKGACEIQGSAGLVSSSLSASGGGSSVTVTTIGVDALFAYCINSHWEFGPSVTVSSTSGGGSTVSTYGVVGNAIYNFAMAGNDLVPFLNAGVGFASTSGGGGSSVSSTILPKVGGGVRCLLGSSASINFIADYQRESAKVSGVTITANDILVQVGLSVFPSGFGESGGGSKK